MALRFLLAPTLALAVSQAAAQTPPQPDGIGQLVSRLESAVLSGDRTVFAQLEVPPGSGPGAEAFWRSMAPQPTQLVIKERDRTSLEDGSQRLLLEVFSSRHDEARVGTWEARVRLTGATDAPEPAPWRVVSLERLTSVTGLYRLTLDPAHQYDVRQLRLIAPDLTLQMDTGSAFVAGTDGGVTAVVLLGRGAMRFTPQEEAEQTQVRIFAGAPAIDTTFDMALLRLHPSQFQPVLDGGMLRPRAVDSGDFRRASGYFDEFVGRSLSLDLNDLSRDRWSLIPQPGDFIAEIRTRRLGSLTYARMQNESEDVTIFDRRHRKNIALYASREKLAERGRFYSEDDTVDYDVHSYDVETDFDPDRFWVEGRTTLTLGIVAPVVSSLTLKIAEPLAVRSVYADGFGRLMYLRVVGQNSVIINLPEPLSRDMSITLRLTYGGRLVSQDLYSEAVALQPPQMQEPETFILTPEPRLIYSTRSYWYPQSPVPDYATARLRITVPAEFDVVASGAPIGVPAPAPGPVRSGERARRMFVFEADRPARYLACAISRFTPVSQSTLDLPTAADPRHATDADSEGGPTDDGTADPGPQLTLAVQATPRQASRVRDIAGRAADILRFYTSILGDAPYPELTVAVSESHMPGGHSPAYLAILNQTLPTSPLVWRNDPVSFNGYPSYFLAHELAHQWWGQAVGWKNYHEQWISEGFAQYFAALNAERERGPDTMADVLRQMQRSAIDASDQGPISLGYRLGHIKSDGRVFRAVLYNKSAMVLHMLRRLVGDDAFFDGLRRFYQDWKFRKAGTDDFRIAMEEASGQDLSRFIDAWIAEPSIPRLRFSREASDKAVTLTFEHLDEIVPVPVTVTLVYADGQTDTVVVAVTERRVSKTVALRGALRDVRVDEEHGVLATIDR
jgi:hypothetical protein